MNVRRASAAVAISMSILTAAPAPAAPAKPAASAKPPDAKRVARGKYLVTTSGCHDCHSPKLNAQMEPDLKRMLSGRPSATTAAPSQTAGEIHASLDLTAWSGPWGISYAANLTPDPETGIGKRYNEAAFIKTIRTGKKPEGEALLPPMPWAVYANMTDEDLKSIYAFLQTIPPVHNAVRAPMPVATAKPAVKKK